MAQSKSKPKPVFLQNVNSCGLNPKALTMFYFGEKKSKIFFPLICGCVQTK